MGPHKIPERRALEGNCIFFQEDPSQVGEIPGHVEALRESLLDFSCTLVDELVHEQQSKDAMMEHIEQQRDAALNLYKGKDREAEWVDYYVQTFFQPLAKGVDVTDIEHSRRLSRASFYYDHFEGLKTRHWTIFKERFADLRRGLKEPVPDWVAYFPIYDFRSDDRVPMSKRWQWTLSPKERLIENFSLDVLQYLAQCGLVPSTAGKFSKEKKRTVLSDYIAYPWLIVEFKQVGYSGQYCFCQAANAAAAALMMFRNLAEYADDKRADRHVPPVAVMTAVGKDVRIWVAYTSKKGKHYDINCIWKGDMSQPSAIIELHVILENLHTWAMRVLRPRISMYIDQWRTRHDPEDEWERLANKRGIDHLIRATNNETSTFVCRRTTQGTCVEEHELFPQQPPTLLEEDCQYDGNEEDSQSTYVSAQLNPSESDDEDKALPATADNGRHDTESPHGSQYALPPTPVQCPISETSLISKKRASARKGSKDHSLLEEREKHTTHELPYTPPQSLPRQEIEASNSVNPPTSSGSRYPSTLSGMQRRSPPFNTKTYGSIDSPSPSSRRQSNARHQSSPNGVDNEDVQVRPQSSLSSHSSLHDRVSPLSEGLPLDKSDLGSAHHRRSISNHSKTFEDGDKVTSDKQCRPSLVNGSLAETGSTTSRPGSRRATKGSIPITPSPRGQTRRKSSNGSPLTPTPTASKAKSDPILSNLARYQPSVESAPPTPPTVNARTKAKSTSALSPVLRLATPALRSSRTDPGDLAKDTRAAVESVTQNDTLDHTGNAGSTMPGSYIF